MSEEHIVALSPRSTWRRPCRSFLLSASSLLCRLSAALGAIRPDHADRAAIAAELLVRRRKRTRRILSAAQQKPAPVTTTVVVHGEVEDNYLPESVTVGTLDGAQLKSTPLSATVITRDLLNDQVSRLLSDVIQNDASVGDDYVPVGYYGDYQIRGFPLDLATGLEVNGMTIAGEQDVPLENKEARRISQGHCRQWRAAWPRRAASSTT